MAKSKPRKKGQGGGRASRRSSKGIFTGMRSGMKNLFGVSQKKSGKKKSLSFWDVLFWLLAGLLGAALIYRWLK